MTNKNLMKKIAPVVLSAAVAMTSMPYVAMAADFTDSEVITDSTEDSDEFTPEDAEDEFAPETEEENTFAAEAQQGEAYVLMNIPYDDFYKAELKNNDVKVDAFTSATLNKSRTAGMMNGNSAYHVDPNGTDVTGVTFPVKVSDLSLLKDQKQVTDHSKGNPIRKDHIQIQQQKNCYRIFQWYSKRYQERYSQDYSNMQWCIQDI